MAINQVFTITLALCALAATAEPQSKKLPDLSDFRLERDLSNYQRYAWNKSQTVLTEKMANHLRIINAVQKQMKRHGYRIDTAHPEVRIQYRLEVRERVRSTSRQQRSVWDNASSTVQIDFDRVKEAHFSVQFVEAESNFFLWEARGIYPVGTPDRAEFLINKAIEDLFKQYPSKE